MPQLESEAHALSAQLECLEQGTRVAVVTLLGSLCPITLGHVQGFEEARRILLGEGVARPLRTPAHTLGYICDRAVPLLHSAMSQMHQSSASPSSATANESYE